MLVTFYRVCSSNSVSILEMYFIFLDEKLKLVQLQQVKAQCSERLKTDMK